MADALYGTHPQAFGQRFGRSPVSSESKTANWAADFQNLHLNEARASPIPQSQFHQHAPRQHSTPGGWHQDFLQQQSRPAPYPPQQQQNRLASGWAYGYTGALVPQEIASSSQQMGPGHQAEENFDDAAFEQEFESATSELQQSRHRTIEADIADQLCQSATEKGPRNEKAPQAWLDRGRLGSDRILGEAAGKQQDRSEQDDADELAKTAGQLLENVSGDQSQKFHDSSFLSLMRQLRDKEVRVEGDQLVDVSMLSPGALAEKDNVGFTFR
ncbi:hypothetical protein P7C71_g610, partial [Lecanoromycetidae sp. Uapishka_2]